MTAPSPSGRPALHWELRDLVLVAAGAVPGALLRWRLEGLALGPFRSEALGAELAANLVGSLLLGFVGAGRTPRPRLMLAVGIGFCGSLTTFSSWMLGVARLLEADRPAPALARLGVSLAAGMLAVTVGALLGGGLSRGRRQLVRIRR
ncbi:MAG: CrcB family protein [Synechococcaceae cyanobacterium]|nr:CrcB family protein [Synechococcaceae cyanobacterium]